MVRVALLVVALPVFSQTDWKAVQKQIENGSYKTAYGKAEGIYNNKNAASRQRLTAAFYMSRAAAHYQEDAYDSSEARYRRLLPMLDGIDRALCYAFLGAYDSALVDTSLLQRTPVEQVREFCNEGKTQNMTPTVYDMLVVMMQDRGAFSTREKIAWQRRLCAFHETDKDDLRIWHDCRLLQFMAEVPNQHIEISTYQRYIDKHRGTRSAGVTRLYHYAAQCCYADGDYVQAVRYCDTAISLFPKSEGGVECAHLRADITAKQMHVEGDGLTLMPGVASPQRVRYRNLSHLWFRVVSFDGNFRWGNESKERALKAAPVSKWDLPLACNDSHRFEEAYFAVPALKAGRYLLLVSPSADFRKEGFMAYEVHCTDMMHYRLGNGNELLVDRRTGLPIVGQEVRLVRRNGDKEKVLGTTRTAADGRFRFDIDNTRWNDYLVAERDGYRLEERYSGYRGRDYVDSSLQCELRVDRPIYRPGDTVHAAAVAYHSDGLDGMVAAGCRMRMVLNDPNGKLVAEDSLLTDDYGVAATTFELSTDRIAGSYTLWVCNGDRRVASKWLRVEEYKQPRFMVTLSPAEGAEAPVFGRETTVQGMAVAYSGVPVGGARVQYRVTRAVQNYFGWRHWYEEGSDLVAEGELTATADGSFTIPFVPEPDSSRWIDSNYAFRYTVHADVTDLNGESHEASTSLRVGYRNTFIALEQSEHDYRELPQLTLHLSDINDRPLGGTVQVSVERLRRPMQPLLVHNTSSPDKVHHTMSEAEWRRQFPLYAYDTKDVSPTLWPVAETVVSGEQRVENGEYRVELPQLISGYYRIKVTSDGAKPVEHILCLTRKDARRVQSDDLLWHDLEKKQAEVGERVALQFGSAFAGTQVYYMLRVGNEDRAFRRIDCRDDAIHTEYIDVDSTMLGGFAVELFTVREGVEKHWSESIEVPFNHKKLNVEISTFRDKLLPGETEEWTIRVESGERRVESAVVMTMYDDALNSYDGGGAWGFSPWRHHYSQQIDINSPSHNYADWLIRSQLPYYSGTYPSVWSLADALPHRWGRGYGRVMYKTAAVRNATLNAVAIEEDAEEEVFSIVEEKIPSIQRLVSDEVESVVAAVGGIGYSDGGTTTAAKPEVQVRQNLGSLAFFAADVRTDSTGTATYRFTVPELLTRWNVKGLAITKDLKIGTLDKTLVTAKPLMVQPNMPRFLRHGDSLSLMAKVVLAEPSSTPQEVTVSLLLTDAATGDTLCRQRQHVAVKDAAQVMFDVEVPQGVYVATYEITAVADGMSDGERGQVPVVGNRQAVTVSQAMYINGAGEKTYSLPEWLERGDSREPQLVVAEAVGNPIWLAIKSMPYMQSHENPSTLYLANQLYVNNLGAKVYDEIKDIISLDDIENPASRLTMNEDVKQTALQATPWLRDAESEEEQMRAVKNYFDTATMRAQHDKLVKELAERQNADGGWSWMPEGQSSLWITQSVLQKVKGNIDTREALKYVDREQQRYYERYIKPYAQKYKWQPTDVDYLFMRSMYGKASTEAYKFYYDNALKNYKRYENLYTQAQLALIFHRHGDRKAALDMLRRLREKSLESDEMGLYWRDNRGGWFWYQRPIETQALLIQAFAEITPDDAETIGLMQQWLLKQKQTSHWGNDRATAEAIRALCLPRSSVDTGTAVALTVFGQPMDAETNGVEGYVSQRWTGADLDTLITHHSSLITLKKSTPGIAWGAVYYQFTDEMDKIPASETGLSIKRTYSNLSNPNNPSILKVGDKLNVRIEITANRAMDYLELVDGRPSCTEPLSTRAGRRWCDGLSYYVTVNNTDTRFYIEHLDKGHYVAEYELYVTNPGTFLAGPVTMQCMYAPEFRAVAPAQRLTVK